MKSHGLVLVLLVALFLAPTAYARKAYLVTAEAEGSSGNADFTEIEEMSEALTNEGLARVVDAYTPTSEANVLLDIRGVPASASYAENSTTLRFEVPAAGISETFAGETRDESQQMFLDWLKGEGGDALTRLLRELAATSPIDPVAGNPNSLMSTMTASDFAAGSEIGLAGIGATQRETSSRAISIGARFGRFSAGDFDTDVYTIPLAYSVALEDPRKVIIVDAPITYIDDNGSASYNASLGLGMRFPVLKNWSITPIARIGAIGSVDHGAASWVYSLSATSNFNLYFDDLKLTIGNMFGYYTTSAISAADYETRYDLQNTSIRNGIGLEGSLPFKMFGGEGTSWQLSLVDTRFFGDKLYIEQYNDISLSVGNRRRQGPEWKNLRLGITVTIGENDYRGARIDFGYRF